MSAQAIGYSAYGSTRSSLEKALQKEREEKDGKEVQSQDSNKGGMKSAIHKQIETILAKIPKGDDNKLSFKEVEAYYEEQKKKWDDEVKADLEKLGVKTHKDFPFAYDPSSGTVTVAKGHPDKEKIDAYFKSNPDKVDKFKEIVQIGKLVRTSQQSTMTPTQMRQSIQKSSMAIWFQDNSDPTSWFSGGGMMFGSHKSSLMGLNLKV